MNNSSLWQNSNIEIDENWVNRLNEETDQASPDERETSDMVQSTCTTENGDQLEDSDNFSEVDENERDGNLDTLLDERELDLDTVLSFAPGEGQQPVGVFSDPDAEYLLFPTIFCGQGRVPETARKVKVSYGDICKWELRSENRRVAMCVPNIFSR